MNQSDGGQEERQREGGPRVHPAQEDSHCVVGPTERLVQQALLLATQVGTPPHPTPAPSHSSLTHVHTHSLHHFPTRSPHPFTHARCSTNTPSDIPTEASAACPPYPYSSSTHAGTPTITPLLLSGASPMQPTSPRVPTDHGQDRAPSPPCAIPHAPCKSVSLTAATLMLCIPLKSRFR